MTEILCWLVGLVVGGVFVGVIKRPRVVPARLDLEPPAPAKTIAEARAALDQFRDRYPSLELKDIGWDLIEITTAAGRADAQLKQAEAKPGNVKEEREALAAVNRLRSKVDMLNRRVAQLRDGSWPDD